MNGRHFATGTDRRSAAVFTGCILKVIGTDTARVLVCGFSMVVVILAGGAVMVTAVFVEASWMRICRDGKRQQQNGY